MLFAAGNKLYFGLGEHRRLSHAAEQLDDFWVFDTQRETWDSIPASFPGGWRTGAVGFTAKGKIYVGTGEDYKDEYGDFYEFTPESNTWRKVGSMTVNPRGNARVISIGGEHYFGFGKGNEESRDFWKFVPESQTWERQEPFYEEDFPEMPEAIENTQEVADKVLALARTIVTIQITLPQSKQTINRTMLMKRHQRIAPLFADEFWGTR